jgi:hypothetical protein
MTATDVAAWLGAAGTVSGVLWEVFKWRTAGPKLDVHIATGMVKMPLPGTATKYVVARVSNNGTALTTITNMSFAVYNSRRDRWRLRSSDGIAFIVASPSSTQPLPFKLEAGAEWAGMAIQDKRVEELMATGDLWCEIHHSWSKRPVQTKVKPKPPTK